MSSLTHHLRQPSHTVADYLRILMVFASIALPNAAHADTQVRNFAFDYDVTTGLLTKEIVEPDNPNLCVVNEYLYDGYGNKTSTTTRNCNGSVGSVSAANSEAAAPSATITVNGVAVTNPAIILPRTNTDIYDVKGQFPTTSTNAIGQIVSKTWDGRFGTLSTFTDLNTLTTTWAYDGFGRKTNEARPDSTSTQISYSLCSVSACNVTQSKYKIVASQSGSAPVTNEYDMLGRSIQSNTQDKDGVYVQSSLIIYDHLGRVSQVAQPSRSGDTLTYTTTTYDKLNRTIGVVAPDGQSTNVNYAGLVTTTTNAKNQTKVETVNAQGQLVTATDANSKSINYLYDAFGNLVKTTDPLGNNILSVYDKRGRKIGMSDPDKGNLSYQYDVLDQAVSQTDAKLQNVTYVYDKLGRVKARAEPDLVTSWIYDSCDSTSNAGGKCKGKLVKESADNGSVTTYSFDALGRLTATLGSGDLAINQAYDSYGRVSSLAYPGGLSVQNVYSSTGYLIKVTDSNSTVLWTANTTDAAGRITKETYGNNIITNRIFDALGRIKQINAGTSANATSVSNQTFVYDNLGNVQQRYDGATGLNEGFGYDSLNRLISTSAQAGTGPLTQVTLTYNEIGNILTKSDVGTYTYASPNANGQSSPHAVSKIMMSDGVTQYAAYSYDANGNQIAGAGRSIVWNSWDMPTTIIGTAQGKSTPNGIGSSTFSFLYNASHERVKEILPDGTTIYNLSPRVDTGIHIEKRIQPNGAISYIHSMYAGGMPFATVTVQGVEGGDPASYSFTYRYLHTDQLGSIVAITNKLGSIMERRSYDAWGKRRNLNGTSLANAFVTPFERHGFTGHEELDEVGLIHMNGRVYDPAISRFESADPVVQYPSYTQSYNRYSYLNNNPLNATDPSGFEGVISFTAPVVTVTAPRIDIPQITLPPSAYPPNYYNDMINGYVNGAINSAQNGNYYYNYGGGNSGQTLVNNGSSPTPTKLVQVGNTPISSGRFAKSLNASNDSGGLYGSFKTGLAVASAFPVIGSVASLAGAGLDFSEGNYVSGTLGLVGAIPFVGTIRAVGKAADALIDVARVESGVARTVPQVEQYALRANESGFYPVMTRGSSSPTGQVWLEQGDVWKYGVTKNPNTRYSQTYLKNIGEAGVTYKTQFAGSRAEALASEKSKILDYENSLGQLPAGNKIRR